MVTKTEVKTEEIAIRDLRPCANCEGSVNPNFHEIRIRDGFINVRAVRGYLGMADGMGFGPAITDIMSPDAGRGASLMDEPNCTSRFFLCQDCFLLKEVNIAVLVEKVRKYPDKFLVPV